LATAKERLINSADHWLDNFIERLLISISHFEIHTIFKMTQGPNLIYSYFYKKII